MWQNAGTAARLGRGCVRAPAAEPTNGWPLSRISVVCLHRTWHGHAEILAAVNACSRTSTRLLGLVCIHVYHTRLERECFRAVRHGTNCRGWQTENDKQTKHGSAACTHVRTSFAAVLPRHAAGVPAAGSRARGRVVVLLASPPRLERVARAGKRDRVPGRLQHKNAHQRPAQRPPAP